MKELYANARASYSSVAKNVGLSKEVVNYRIKRLLDIGFFRCFNTVVDIRKIGMEMFFAYIKLRNIDVEKEKEILLFLKNHPHTAWVVKTIGSYDIVMKLVTKTSAEADALLKDIELQYKGHIDSYHIDDVMEEHAIPFTFLYGTEKDTTLHYISPTEGKAELADIDQKILRALAKNARLPVTELAKQIKVSTELAKYHLKKLENNKVILKYRPEAWSGVRQLGYSWYLLMLKVGKLGKATQTSFESYVLHHPNMTYLYKTVGFSDLNIEMRIKTTEDLSRILLEIRGILKEVLRHHELLLILEEHKYTYFPECLVPS